MDYGDVLRRSWEIVWKHKALWIFGILAGCSSNGGGGGGGNSGFQFSGGDQPPRIEPFMESIPEWQIAVFIAAVFLVVLLLIVLFVFLGTIGRIGLIKGTLRAEEDQERITFGELFSDSLPHFWRIFGLNLLVGVSIAVLILLLVLLGVAFGVVTLGIGFVLLIPLLCIGVPALVVGLWLVQVIVEQANVAIVTEELGIQDGLRRGWEVFRDNLGVMVVMGLILILGSAIVSFVIAAPLVAVVVPIITGAVIGTDLALGGGIAFAGLCLLIYLPLLIVAGGIVRAFVGSAWTLTFMRLTAQPGALIAEGT